MFVVCERWVETRTDCYIDPSSPLDHSSISFSSWLGLLNRGSLRAQCPQSASCFSRWYLVSNCLKPSRHLVIFSNVHLLPLFFHLFTQVRLLIDGSVEGQLKHQQKHSELSNFTSRDQNNIKCVSYPSKSDKRRVFWGFFQIRSIFLLKNVEALTFFFYSRLNMKKTKFKLLFLSQKRY